MKISVIIVSYNVCSYLRQCLVSIQKSTRADSIETIVVDNNSFDNSVAAVRKEFPSVSLIINSENRGFAAAVNQGIQASSGDFICLVNPDAMVTQGTFAVLSDYLSEHEDTGVVGCKVLDADGKLQLASRRNFPSPMVILPKLLGLNRLFPGSKIFGQYNQTFMDPDLIQEVDAVSGCCMMFRRRDFDAVGGFDEQFFLYFEETDFCYRMKKSGLKIIYNPETRIIHYKGESLKHAEFDNVSVFHDAMQKFITKHSHEFKPWWLFRILLLIATLFSKTTAYLQKHRRSLVSAILDTGAIFLAFTISILIWYPYYYSTPGDLPLIVHHWELIAVYFLIWIYIANLLSLYKKNHLSYGRSFVASGVTFFVAASLTYFISYFAHSRAVLLFSFIISTLLLSGWRIIVQILYRYGKISISHVDLLFTRRAIIIGKDEEARRIGSLLENSPSNDFNLVGYVAGTSPSHPEDEFELLGLLKDLPTIIKNNHVNEIIIPEKYFTVDHFIQIIQEAVDLNVSFKFVSAGHHHLIGKGVVENLGGVPLVDIEFPLYDRLHLLTKRIFDILFSLAVLMITAPVHLYFLSVGKVSKREIWNIGHSSIFIPQYNSQINWIRELPCFYTILTGKMSFVGSQIIDYANADPSILFKPGLTGLAQVKTSGVREDMIRFFDQYYIQNQSIIFDLEIILKSLLRI